MFLHTSYLLINAHYRFDNTWLLSNKGKGLSQSKQNIGRSKTCDKVHRDYYMAFFVSYPINPRLPYQPEGRRVDMGYDTKNVIS